MNKIHRLVWNVATMTWVAVAEHARARGKTAALTSTLVAALALPALAQPAPPPQPSTPPTTLPTGGQVVAGQASIGQQGSTLTVNQGSGRAAIDWATFNVGSQAQVRFEQPSAQSVTLNRVQDNNASQIFGRISANGQVFLSNPNGVFFAPGASVDVGGLVATTHRISLDDFMAGRTRFERSGATGSVVNEGELKAALGGYIALLAPEVRNQGVIVANLGTVALAAGEAFELQFDANNTLAALRVEASTIKALVDNRSAVLAPGGLVILSARALDAVQGGVIRHSGHIEASSLVDKGGRIVLEGGDITLAAGSRLDASGASGGGSVLVGGDWQGSGTMAQATTVTMDTSASIDASATQRGDGGTVVLWSDVNRADSLTTAAGSLRARGGAEGGNGGQIETSGHQLQADGARVDTLAPQGRTGLWLLDPNAVTVAASGGTISGATIASNLNSTDVIVQTAATAVGDMGTIVINDNIAYTGASARTLTFKAHNDITLNSGRSITSSTARLNTVLRSRFYTAAAPDQGAVTVNGNINTNGGGLWIGGGTGDTTWTPYVGASAITVANSIAATWSPGVGGVSLSGATINTGAGNVYMAGQEFPSGLSGGVNSVGVRVLNSSITTTSGNIDIAGSVNGAFDTAAAVELRANGGSTTLQTGSGAITITGTGTDNNTAGNGWRHGVLLVANTAGHQTVLRSTSGAINVNGAAGYTNARTTDSSGLQLQANTATSTVHVVSQSGNISLKGSNTQEAGVDENAIRFSAADVANSIRIGFDGSSAYSGNILIEGNSLRQHQQNGVPGSIAVQTTGALTVQPAGSSFTQLRAGAGALTFDDDWNFGSTLSSFTLGKTSNTADLTLSNALSVAGGINLYGGQIALNAALTSTGTGDINLISNAATTSAIVSSGSISKTGGGNSTLTVRSNGRVNLGGAITNTSTSGVLNVVLWSDYGNATNYGVSVVPTITTRGGHLWVGGSNSANGSTTWNGLTVGDGAAAGGAGNLHTIDLAGALSTANGAAGGDVYLWGGTSTNGGGVSLNGFGGFTGITAGSGNITLRGNTFNLPAAVNITNTGGFTLWSASGAIGTDTGSFGQATDLNLFKFNAAPSALTWGGSANTQNVTFSATQNATLAVAGPVAVYGGNIFLNNDVTSSLAGADLLAKASGNIVLANGRVLQSNGGDITLWADSDASGAGYIQLVNNNRLDSRTAAARSANVEAGDGSSASGGGNITLGGGNGATAADGYATSANTAMIGGVNLGSQSDTSNSTTLYSGGGDVMIRGRQTGTSAMAVQWINSGVVNAGQGTVQIEGINTGGGHGTELGAFRTSGDVRILASGGSAGTPGIDIQGSGAGAGSRGVLAQTVRLYSTGAGGINIAGTSVAGDRPGIDARNILDVLAASGPITLDGGTAGIEHVGSIGALAGSPVTASSSNVTLTGNTVVFGADGAAVRTTGTLTVQPFSTSFSSPLTWPLPNFFALATTVGGLTLGKPGNTADITVSAAQTLNGPINIYGGNITLNGSLTSLLAGADILAKANGNIVLAANTQITSNLGDITLWSDADNNAQGYIAMDQGVRLNTINGATSGSGGGRLTMAGGLDSNADGIPDGYASAASTDTAVLGSAHNPGNNIYSHAPAGVSIGFYEAKTIYANDFRFHTGGGEVVIKGRSANGTPGVVWYGGHGGTQILDAGSGAITLEGQASNAHGMELSFFGGSSSPTLHSSSNAATAISVTGTSTSAGQSGYQGSATLVASGSGGISLSGTARDNGKGVTGGLGLHAASGDIVVTGSVTGTGAGPGIDIGGSLGKGSGLAASSSNITLNADRINFSAATVDTTGTLTVQPLSTSFASGLISPLANLTLAPTLSGLTLGKEGNTADITVGAAQAIAGPISLYGGNISLNADLSSSQAGADILVKASGNITTNAYRTLQTNNGDLTLWADNDANGAGNIIIGNGNTLNTANGATNQASGGGHITLAGGLDNGAATVTTGRTAGDGRPDGYASAATTATNFNTGAGVSLGVGSNVHSGGGDVFVAGQGAASTAAGGVQTSGIWFWSGLVDSGTGKLALYGKNVATNNVNNANSFGIHLNTGSSDNTTTTLISASSAADAITLVGDSSVSTTTGSSGLLAYFSNTGGTVGTRIAATGGGGITLTGKGSTGANATGTGELGDGIDLNFVEMLSTGGPITLNGTGGPYGISLGGRNRAGNFVTLGRAAGVTVNGQSMAASSSPITLNADALRVNAGGSSGWSGSIASSGTLTVQPLGTSFASALSWPQGFALSTDLSGLTLGKTGNTADITINNTLTVAGPVVLYGGNLTLNAGVTATGSTLTLQGSGTVSDGPSGFVAASSLQLNGGNITLDSALNNVSTLAANGVGSLHYRNSAALSLGAVTGSGDVDIATASGDLTVTQNVATSSASATALTLNAGASSAAGTATGGNLLISGSPTVSVGGGGMARLYSGSVAGSSGLTALVGSGSGRFRYHSDEAANNFTLALDPGLNAIYREQPTVQVAVGNASMVYGDAVPAGSFTLTGGVNGDTAAQAFATLPTLGVDGTTSTSGHAVVGTHNFTVSGGSASSQLGYAVSSSGNAGTLTVTPRPLLASFTGVDKDYDGNTSATVTVSDDRIASDVFTVGHGSASFASRNVGTGIGISLTGITVTGTDAANYSVAATGSASADITPRQVTITGLSAAGKTYDGNTDVTVTHWGAVATGVAGETLVLVNSGNASFDTATAGNGKTVTATGYTLANGSGLASNYELTSTSATTTADIAKAVLTVTARDEAKFVTLADPVNFGGVHITGFVAGETSAVLGGSADVVRTNAGVETAGRYTGVLVPDVSGLTSNNYVFNVQAGTFTIVPSNQLLVRVADANSVYGSAAAYSFTSAAYFDGSVVHNLALPGAANPDGSFTISDGAGASATFRLVPSAASLSGAGLAPVGSHTLAASGLWATNPQNFNNDFSVVGLQTVTPKSVTVGTGSGPSKVYDGSTAMSGVNLSVPGLESGDAVVATGTGSFNSRNAGTSLGYTVANLALTGADAGNYLLTGATTLSGSNGSITPAPITVGTADVHKTYDGNTSALGRLAVLAGTLYGGDSLGGGSFAFSDKNAGTGKTINVSGVSVSDGNGGANYLLQYAANTSSSIAPAPLTVSAADVHKTYDGSTTAVSSPVVSAGELFGSDSLSGGSFAFADKNVGTGKTVNVSGVSVVDGNGGANYALQYLANTGSRITPAALTVTTNDVHKAYDGTTAASGSAVLMTGTLFGDDTLVGGSFAFGDKNAGTGKTVTASGVTVADGHGGANYTLRYVANTQSSITPAALTVSTGDVSKTYDGNTGAQGIATVVTGTLFQGDRLTGGTFTFDDKNVGTGKTVTVAGITVADGHGGGNYVLQILPNTNSRITRLDSVTWIGGASGNWFDPANWAGGAVPDLANVANVVIPAPAIVSFDPTAAVAPAQAGPVQIDSLGSSGSLAQSGGTLEIGAGGVTLGGFTQTGGSTSTQGNFTVNGPFEQGSQGSVAVGGNVQITNPQGGVTLGNLSTPGTLGVLSNGSIGQAGGTTITVGGQTTLDAGSGNVVLDGPGNNFVGPVDVRGHDITLVDGSGGLTLGTVAAGGSLTATSTGGAITQAPGSTVTVGGNTRLDAGSNAVVLDGPGNDFVGPVDVRGGDVTLVDGTGGLTLGSVTAGGSLNVRSNGGDLSQAPGSAIQVRGSTTLGASTGVITLAPTGNQFAGGVTVTGPVSGGGGAGPGNTPPLPPPVLPQTLPTPTSGPPALSEVMGNTLLSSAGVQLRLSAAVADQPSLLTVTVAQALLPSGFSFVLPLALTEGQRADVAITATQADGSALPAWLRFDREERRFVATAVPPGGLPLRLVVTVGMQRTVIVLAADGA